ncbi:preprotein translocase subunit YajC [Pseudothauera nasutitermitis]|uniref:preprotein translocase subunit YajC n=1 Tax=Pseudothauera nasutitermitis TaxID=2565930 RepID=UPI001454C2E4|nr:preprotein translocase subunit YajC [Pseudothauera nasutitermitis]
MRLTDLGTLPLTLIASLVVAVVLLTIRIVIMQRVQQRRQRENRQETERLKSLVAAYRSLAGSFTPAEQEHGTQIEETLADIVLFGSLAQVELAARAATELKRGETVDYQPLVEALRADLRTQLGLEAIPPSLALPPSGPGRTQRTGRGDGEGGGRGEGRGGGGGGGGAGGGAIGVGGLAAGMAVADTGSPRDPS